MSEARITAERDLYRRMLEASGSDQPRGLLDSVLGSLMELTDSARVYLELFHPVSGERFGLQRGVSDEDVDRIRAVTSRGIVAAALEAGTVLHTSSAQLDRRFASLESVRSQQLEAVVCVPVPGRPPGVLYLEGKRGAGPYADSDVQLASFVAANVGPILQRAAIFAPSTHDATRAVRERLEASAIVGRSVALARVLERAALAAPLDVVVLLSGEPGTGKTQLARLIHDNSRRRTEPFIELNCAALQDTLVESELFGTTSGAYTGAKTAQGKVDAASGGTLFLDEVGELSPSAQAKLLQLLQSRQFYPVGSTKLKTANVRVIGATNARLSEAVAAGRFREDLFYRLNVMEIRLPALRERTEDLEPLIAELVARVADEHGLPRLPLSPALKTRWLLDPWPGNVRQLRNAVETALICAAGEHCAQIEPRHFDSTAPHTTARLSYHEATRAFQREFLQRELADAKGNVAELARRIDLSRPYLSDLLKSFQLNKP